MQSFSLIGLMCNPLGSKVLKFLKTKSPYNQELLKLQLLNITPKEFEKTQMKFQQFLISRTQQARKREFGEFLKSDFKDPTSLYSMEGILEREEYDKSAPAILYPKIWRESIINNQHQLFHIPKILNITLILGKITFSFLM